MTDRKGGPDAVLLAGPTASGKSALALQLTQRIGGTIVNADSMQMHASLRVVTARPSEADEALVPHRLYGTVAPFEPMSAAGYVKRVRTLLPELRALGRVPIFVGGTGLYFKALEEGLSAMPPIDPTIRAELRSWNAAQLANALHRDDPAAAERLRATDTQRLARALEVVRSTGRSILDWQGRVEPGPLGGANLRRVLFLPERAWLHERIARRAAEIVADPAALAEVEALVVLDPELRSLPAKAIGVRELVELERGAIDAEEAVRRLTVATRRYAKRQYTWFNNSLGGDWTIVRPPDEPTDALIRSFMRPKT